ncbi:type IV secretory system conjugative DNA transfer family protein [Salinilacihabitans rarus]|uniref:type IV secretory system conjugative DNA transfer family protein n=1 Tax=Salinilacihabitans rarus TaxID=2961596 RepID=UPI0020C8706D|nr:type IV secretory system conjugative DNA transfer family protein [Salinilacihabitans rarus]
MIRVPFPVPIDTKVKFMDRFTVGDFGRIGIPALIGWGLAGDLGAVAGTIIGLGFVAFKQGDRHLDEHIATLIGFGSVVQVSSPSFEQLHNDAVVLDNGTVLGLVKVSSCDIQTLSDLEKTANLATVHELMKTLGYQVELHSRQRTVDLSQYSGAADSEVVTDHVVVVRVDESTHTSVQERLQAIDKRCTEIRNALTAADLYAERITGDAFKTHLKRLYFGKTKLDRRRYETEYGEKQVRQLRYVTEYPAELELAWLADLLSVEAPGLVSVVQVAKPISTYQRTWISRMISRLKIELQETRSPAREVDLRRRLRDAEDLLDIEGRSEVLLNYGVYITVAGSTPEEVDETWKAVETVLSKKQIQTEEPALKTHKAVRAASAYHADALHETVIVPGRSAASGFPFASGDTIEEDGVVVGQDASEGTSVILDRFSWDAGHMTVMGKTGSGKSYWTGLMLLRSAQTYDNLDIYILDPKRRDYGAVTDSLGGQTVVLDHVNLTAVEPDGVTRYTVEDPSQDNTELLVEALGHIYREASKTDSKVLVVVDEAHRPITIGDRINHDGLNTVSRLIRESRDRNIAVTLITQNADEFTRSREGKNILRNVDCNLFFKQEDVDTEIEPFFNLIGTESGELHRLRTGSDLPFSTALLRGPVNTTLRIKATDREHDILETGHADEDSGLEAISDRPRRVVESDGGQPNADKHQQDSDNSPDSNRKMLTLLASLNLASKASIKRFELGLFTGVIGGLLLSVLGVVESRTLIQILDPVGIIPTEPTNLGVLITLAVAFVAIEVLWVLVLGIAVRLTGVPQS